MSRNSEGRVIPFYKHRKVYFAVSLSIMLIGVVALCIKGVALDIQFKGGAMLKYDYIGATIDSEAAADLATQLLKRPVTAQTTTDLATGDERLVINIAGEGGLDALEQDALIDSLRERFPSNNLELSESSMVQPFFGRQFLINGVISLLLAAALVVVYVWFRFRRIGGLSAGMMALVALFHDMLVAFFVYVIFGIPIGDSFVAVALTIIGYSINDTIVIYDRIRENDRLYPKLPVETVTDLSISQSMMRSINTNLAVMLSVSLVYILAFSHGIDSIKSFALPMAIGSISGCYSTICIAGPLWVSWQKRPKDKAGQKGKAKKKKK